MEAPPPVRFTRTADGVSIAYMVWPGRGIPFLRVRVPGAMPMALSATLEDVRRFGGDRPMVWFDWRGTGQSERRAAASIGDLMLDIDAVMSSIDCDMVDVLAPGMACLPACTYAASREARWRSLLLNDPALRVEGSTWAVDLRPGYEVDYEGFFTSQTRQFLPPMSNEETERIARSWAETVPVDAHLAFRSIEQKMDLADSLGALEMPVLILKVTPRSRADSVAALIKNSILVERRHAYYGRGLRQEWDKYIGSQFAEPPQAATAATGAGTNGLSSREVEVLGLLAGGCSNRQIATALTITEATVARHVLNIYSKLDVHNRAEATRWAIEHGVG